MLTTTSRFVSADRAAASHDVSITVTRAALWALIVTKLIGGWGVQWDIEWHVRVGRDTFWIVPHLITYGGIGASVLVSWGMLAWYTARGARGRDIVRVLGISGSRGFHLAAWGGALTVLAAPIDDLWHRLFGLDVTLWSPPHLLGLLGGLVSSAGCLLIAREVYRNRPLARWIALVLAGTLLYRGLALVAQPAFLVLYARGGFWFHLPAMMSAALLPLALVAVALLTGRRWSPAAVVLAAMLTALVGQSIADKGFEVIEPVSVIDAEIAKDPTSPIAVATMIARENGERPGRSSLGGMIPSLLAAVALAAVDARRRPALAALAYGLVLVVVWRWLLGHAPAFSALAPGISMTLAALGVAGVAALVSGAAGRAMALALGADRD